MKTAKTLVMLTLLSVLVQGCQTSARRAPLPVSAEDNTARLIASQDFAAAARAAPAWVDDALKTITRLEKDLANAGR